MVNQDSILKKLLGIVSLEFEVVIIIYDEMFKTSKTYKRMKTFLILERDELCILREMQK